MGLSLVKGALEVNALPQTVRAISKLRANEHIRFGMHTAGQVEIGNLGIIVGEEPFDPAIHDPLDIDPLSIWEDILDEPQVPQVIPTHGLNFNIVSHIDPDEKDGPKWLAPMGLVRTTLMRRLGQDMRKARLPGDRVRSRTIENKTDEDAIKEISEIAKSGLTFIIGSFNSLELPRLKNTGVVAVKVNHPWELELPSGVGSIQLAGVRACDTDKLKELASTNAELRDRHRGIVNGLQTAGAVIAEIVFQASFLTDEKPARIDEASFTGAVDPILASVIGKLGLR